MREIFGLLERIAPTDATVLIERRDRHRQGRGRARGRTPAVARKSGPFIVVDCGAVWGTL